MLFTSANGECEAVWPKGIPLEFIAQLNRDVVRAAFHGHREPLVVHGAPDQPAHESAGRRHVAPVTRTSLTVRKEGASR